MGISATPQGTPLPPPSPPANGVIVNPTYGMSPAPLGALDTAFLISSPPLPRGPDGAQTAVGQLPPSPPPLQQQQHDSPSFVRKASATSEIQDPSRMPDDNMRRLSASSLSMAGNFLGHIGEENDNGDGGGGDESWSSAQWKQEIGTRASLSELAVQSTVSTVAEETDGDLAAAASAEGDAEGHDGPLRQVRPDDRDAALAKLGSARGVDPFASAPTPAASRSGQFVKGAAAVSVEAGMAATGKARRASVDTNKVVVAPPAPGVSTAEEGGSTDHPPNSARQQGAVLERPKPPTSGGFFPPPAALHSQESAKITGGDPTALSTDGFERSLENIELVDLDGTPNSGAANENGPTPTKVLAGAGAGADGSGTSPPPPTAGLSDKEKKRQQRHLFASRLTAADQAGFGMGDGRKPVGRPGPAVAMPPAAALRRGSADSNSSASAMARSMARRSSNGSTAGQSPERPARSAMAMARRDSETSASGGDPRTQVSDASPVSSSSSRKMGSMGDPRTQRSDAAPGGGGRVRALPQPRGGGGDPRTQASDASPTSSSSRPVRKRASRLDEQMQRTRDAGPKFGAKPQLGRGAQGFPPRAARPGGLPSPDSRKVDPFAPPGRKPNRRAGAAGQPPSPSRSTAGGGEAHSISTLKATYTEGLSTIFATKGLAATDVFKTLDVKGTGTMNKDAFYVGGRIAGISMTREQSDRLFAALDSTGSGAIDDSVFKALAP
jgi:hypothetical protein